MATKKTNTEKELQGTLKPERRKISKLKTLKRIPKPSFELSPEAKKTFRAVCRIMMEENVATALDVYAITNFAFWFHQLIEANKKIKATGMVQVYKSGATAISGFFTAAAKCDSIVQQYMKSLGLTPKHRELIAAFNDIEADKEEDPLALLFEEINNNSKT